jgi:4-hydroxybenzoyl-CoA thioesterase
MFSPRLAADAGKLREAKEDETMSAFQREILVRFGHCDAAGWVFYPRYFEMISDFVEDWFEDGLAASAPGLFHHKQILTPSVHFTVDFIKPTRYGERLTFNLWVVKAGTTSCELRIEASHQGELRMRAKQVLVFISAASARATAIPPELISRMHRFTAEVDTAAQAKKRKSKTHAPAAATRSD